MASCQPFAIMRLTHEALRRGLEEVDIACDTAGVRGAHSAGEALSPLWDVIRLHADQEDRAFYPPLEEKAPGISRSFTATHDYERTRTPGLQARLVAAEDEVSAQACLDSLRSWIEDTRRHLVEEEDILQPLLPKEFTYVESVGVVRGILAHDVAAHEAALPWVFQRLNAGQRAMYLSVLAACSPEGTLSRFIDRLEPLMGADERARYVADGLLPPA